jgi:hypothetical protein
MRGMDHPHQAILVQTHVYIARMITRTMDASLVWITMQRIHKPVIIPGLIHSKEQNLDQVWLSLCENDFLIQYIILCFFYSL